MEHTIQQYLVQDSTEGMVAVSVYLTHDGIFKSSQWIRFRTSYEEFQTNKELGLIIPIECPSCGEVVQFPAMIVNDGGFLQISPEGIEELERRGIEFD